MNPISVPRHIYKDASIKINCDDNKQSLKTSSDTKEESSLALKE